MTQSTTPIANQSPQPVPPPPSELSEEVELLRREVERLRISSEKEGNLLATILNESPHGIIVADRNGRLILQNPAAERIWAGSATANDIQDWGQYRAFHPDGRPYQPSDWGMAVCLRDRAVVEAHEVRIQRFDGSLATLLSSAAPLYDAQGELVGAISIFADVTAMRQAETEREQAQRALKLLADAGELLASSLDFQKTLSDLARLMVPTMADWSAIDILNDAGGIERVVVHHQDPARVALALAYQARFPVDPAAENGVPHVLRTGQVELVPALPDLEPLVRDSEQLAMLRALDIRSYLIVPLVARARPVGALTLVYSESGRTYTPADVQLAKEVARRTGMAIENALLFRTTQEREQNLQEQADLLEVLNRVGTALTAELELDKLVQTVTDAGTRLTGAEFGAFFYNLTDSRGETLSRHAVSGLPSDTFSKPAAAFNLNTSGQGVVRIDDVGQDPRYTGIVPLPGMPEGHPPVKSYLAVPVISRSGMVIGGLVFGHARPGAFTDRAERLVVGLASQAAVSMDNARLFREAQELIEALGRSNRDLDQFAYVASHDLKAPLRGIASLSQWLEEDLKPTLTGESLKQMELLRGRVHRLEALIDGILDYSRAGRARSKPEPVDVGALLAEVVELVAPKPPAQIKAAPGMPTLVTERIQLQQVFMNLVNNALKHAGRPDVTVRIEARDLGRDVEFSVIDDGIGIAPEFHDRIWAIFQTLEPRDKVESTGIGLAVVRKIVQGRGGRIAVESQLGQGATFRFTWPKHEEPRR